jgi:hypothetical protein
LNRRLLISILGLALWLSVLPRLFLLPPTEVAQYVELFKKTISEHSECLPSCEAADPEWKAQMNNYISNARDQENLLWVKWFALFSLVLSALIGWLFFKLNKPFAKWVILITSTLLVLRNAAFHSTSYLGFSKVVLGGGIHLLPWQMIVSSFFYLLVLPLALIILTIMAFGEDSNLTHHSSGTPNGAP